jgi:uncharacterized protein with gpF-like domain
MGIFDFLFHRNRGQASIAIDMPGHPGGARVQRPSRKGRTPEQIAADTEAYNRERLAKGRARFAFDEERSASIGVKAYRWRSCGDFDTCTACRRNNGKRFLYAKPPASGHPGTFMCDQGDGDSTPCRCIDKPITPPDRRSLPL